MVQPSKMPDTPALWQQLFGNMQEKVVEIENGTIDRISKIRLCIQICRSAVESLQQHIHTYVFQFPEEEIYFFKEVKPVFFSRLIYYLKLLNLEAGRPAPLSKLWEPRLNRVLERLQYFFDNNSEFFQYYRSGDTYLDAQYFRREAHDFYLKLDDYYFSYDKSFSTSHDMMVAKILANERLYLYVSDCITQLSKKEEREEAGSSAISALHWTATKAGLIELLYALQSAGAFNNGASDLKQVASYFEQIFHIELGNYYNVFQEIRLRKKNRTTFLDQLKERLLIRMNEADDNSK